MVSKVHISSLRLADLTAQMPEHAALTFMSRIRNQAIIEGLCVTSVIRGGKVIQQNIWRYR